MRVSTRKQDHDLQLDELRQVARQRGWEVTEYVDTGTGKGGAKLAERERLMEDARAGKLDVVAVWRFDRFARSTRDLLNALESFKAWGVQFVSLREGIDTSTPTGQLVFTVIAALAEFERNLIRERVKAGIDTARRKGKKLGRPRAFVAVAKARTLLAEGYSYRKCAKKLGVDVRTMKRALQRSDNEAGQNPPRNGDAETLENSQLEDCENAGGKS